MKTFDRIINFFTYLLTICFVLTIQLIAYLGCKVILTQLPIYFPTMKGVNFITVVVWGGTLFTMIILTRVAYPLYKKHIFIKTK